MRRSRTRGQWAVHPQRTQRAHAAHTQPNRSLCTSDAALTQRTVPPQPRLNVPRMWIAKIVRRMRSVAPPELVDRSDRVSLVGDPWACVSGRAAAPQAQGPAWQSADPNGA